MHLPDIESIRLIILLFVASTKFQLSLTHPDFGQHGVDDLFRSLGPVAIFSAKRHWTAPRLIQLQRGPGGEGFGFCVRGDAPVIVAAVDHNSLADVSGVLGSNMNRL